MNKKKRKDGIRLKEVDLRKYFFNLTFLDVTSMLEPSSAHLSTIEN